VNGTPTLTPSPQGGGKLALRQTSLLPLNAHPSSPSPLWGGIKGGGRGTAGRKETRP